MFINAKTSLIVVVIFFFTCVTSNLNAQTPSTCFEIESILVDACGTIEGENEMVRFVVGPSNLNVNNLNVSWPNASNAYLGICKNSTTASKVAALNSSIVGCGFLKEPTSNILPAGSKVILLTSTSFDVSANSFANLNDTVYVIFQCSGNTAGHFANFGTGTRTLTMSFSSPVGCSDAITYNRALLVDPTGIPVASDGGRVDYTWSGTPTYTNDGCSAPIEITAIDITTPSPTICSGETINLSSTILGNITGLQWSGGNGVFTSPNTTSTNYVSSTGDATDFYIYLSGTTSCGEILKDSLLIQIGGNNSSVNISATTSEICNGDSILLTASGTGNYTWNTGSTNTSIYVSSAGSYFVTSTSSCGSSSDTITITDAPTINLALIASSTEICDGNSATLTASGAPNYTWFNGNTNNSENVTSSGNYYVIGYNNCYRDSQSVFINVIHQPTVSISSSAPSLEICVGESITLTATGSGNYLWNTSATSTSIVVTSAGSYTVSSSNTCFSVSDTVTIVNGIFPVASIVGDSILCNNEVITLSASGGDNYIWSNGNTSSSSTFNSGGQVYVIAANNCGVDTAYFNISNFSLSASFTSDYVYGSDVPIDVIFTNTSTNATTYHWNFGNGNLSSIENPTNTYTTNGTYSVSLTASNLHCSDVFETELIFETPNGVFIPNVFTPNNDGTNDVFSIVGENIAALHAEIYNRWGEKLFSWDSVTDFWDGTYNGKSASDGTYFYVAKIKWQDKTEETIRGHVTLLK